MKATAAAKNIGHDYWEIFENTNAAATSQNLNSVQVRNHNKEYLDAYKKNVMATPGRNATYRTSAYSTDDSSKKKIKTESAFFDETVKGLVVNGSHLSPRQRSVRSGFVDYMQSKD
jgi:hypothetical protein